MQDMNNLESYFLQDIERQSRLEIDKLKEEQDATCKRALDEIQTELKKEATTILEQELKDLTSEYTVKNSKINEEKNRKLMKKREEMTNLIFDEATTKLQAFVKSDAYIAAMKQQLSDLHIDADQELVFYISAVDEQRQKDIFMDVSHAVIKVDPLICIGGFRMENERAGIVVDETLDTRISDEKAWFYANSSLAIR